MCSNIIDFVILGNLKQEDDDILQVLQINKIFPNRNLEAVIVNRIKEKINIQNGCKHKFVTLFFQLSSFYNLKGFRNDALNYIYRWFTIIAKIENFQHLEFNNISRILSSCELNISSELEVFNASDFWLCYDSFDRSKFAKQLFLKTRFPLLSNHVSKSLLEKNLNSFHKSRECLLLIEEVLKNKEEFYRNMSTIYHTNRYCNSNMYNILLCGGFDNRTFKKNMKFYHFEAESFKEVEKYTQTMNWRIFNTAFVKNMVYLLNYDDNSKQLLFII